MDRIQSDAEFLADFPTADIKSIIARWQNVQKQNGPDSPEGVHASKRLAPLFTEMARRQAAGMPV